VWVLVNEAAANIETLCQFGVNFDRKSNDELALSREGAHSKNRIIHAGDTTGKEVCDKLISVVRTKQNVKIKERVAAIDLITEDNVCKGILAYHEDSSSYVFYRANVVVCATGGYGQLYSNTSAELMDLEFVQFHPTVLFHPENKSFLISEAVN